MKRIFILICFFILIVNRSVYAQNNPWFTPTYFGSIDYATNRFFIGGIMFVIQPDQINQPLIRSISNWAIDFFNSNTGMNFIDEKTDPFSLYYEKIFKNKTKPLNETMGLGMPLVYDNKFFVTYKAQFGHTLNETTYKTDVATFERTDGHRLSMEEIFECESSVIKKMMLENIPSSFPCDIKAPEDIKIFSAGLNKNTVDVVGTICKGNTAVYQIPYSEALDYLTDKVYKLCGLQSMCSSYEKKSKRLDGMNTDINSDTELFFSYLLNKEESTFGLYHNVCLDKDFVVQLDSKYDLDKEGLHRNKNPKKRIYIEIPSDDANKEAYLEFSKSDAESFISLLQNHQKDYNSWLKKMQSQQFSKYKLIDQGKGESNISYFIRDSKLYGYEENRSFIIQYVYFKPTNSTALLLKTGKKTGFVKRLLHLSSSNESGTQDIELYEDKLSGWTLVFQEPEKEIPELCKAITNCIDNIK